MGDTFPPTAPTGTAPPFGLTFPPSEICAHAEGCCENGDKKTKLGCCPNLSGKSFARLCGSIVGFAQGHDTCIQGHNFHQRCQCTGKYGCCPLSAGTYPPDVSPPVVRAATEGSRQQTLLSLPPPPGVPKLCPHDTCILPHPFYKRCVCPHPHGCCPDWSPKDCHGPSEIVCDPLKTFEERCVCPKEYVLGCCPRTTLPKICTIDTCVLTDTPAQRCPTPPPKWTPPPRNTTDPPAPCKDATDPEMEEAFGKKGATCKHAKIDACLCSVKKLCKLCPESCGSCPSNGENADSLCPKPTCTKVPGKHTPPPWAAPTADPGTKECVDANARDVGHAFADLGASCQEAASKGHCTKKKVRDLCCSMCKCADKMGNTACKLGPGHCGATVSIEEGVCKAYNPHSHNEHCWDASVKEMEAEFGPSASCGHVQAFGQCNASEKVRNMCCASCGGQATAPPSPPPTLPAWEQPKKGCSDLFDKDFTRFWYKAHDDQVVQNIIHNNKDVKSCPHAMFHGLCTNSEIRKHCCGSCTSDEGQICVDKSAAAVSDLLGESGVSCGLLAHAGRCDNSYVKTSCCASCRKYELYPTCDDVTEQELRQLIGKAHNDVGEGGCLQAAALGQCESSSVVHRACCKSCTLHSVTFAADHLQ